MCITSSAKCLDLLLQYLIRKHLTYWRRQFLIAQWIPDKASFVTRGANKTSNGKSRDVTNENIRNGSRAEFKSLLKYFSLVPSFHMRLFFFTRSRTSENGNNQYLSTGFLGLKAGGSAAAFRVYLSLVSLLVHKTMININPDQAVWRYQQPELDWLHSSRIS